MSIDYKFNEANLIDEFKDYIDDFSYIRKKFFQTKGNKCHLTFIIFPEI